MNKKNPIGILDSGVGGLTVLSEIIKIMPEENIVYFGDSKRMPYGNRSEDEIITYANEMISFLEKEGAKIILLACNTISSYIESLTHTAPLISIIDAGCEYIVKTISNGTVGLIATKATVRSSAYETVLAKKNPEIQIIAHESTKLPKIIDSHIDNRPLLDKHIKSTINPIIDKYPNIKYLVLGCSHFPIIKNEISEMYPNITLLDPAKQMVKDTKEYLQEKSLLNDKEEHPCRILYTTADTLEFASYIKRLQLSITKLEKVKLLPSD